MPSSTVGSKPLEDSLCALAGHASFSENQKKGEMREAMPIHIQLLSRQCCVKFKHFNLVYSHRMMTGRFAWFNSPP